MFSRLRTLLLLTIAAATGTPALFAEDPVLAAWLTTFADSQLALRRQAIAAITTTTQAEAHKGAVRAAMLGLIGGLPLYNGPLNASVTGHIDMGSYAVDNVQFESLPGFWITANLYLPKTTGPHPAILMQIGHWDEGKTFEENFSAVFATKGFVVLAFDPIGQGERLQGYNPSTHSSLVSPSVPQHVQAGGQALLLGENLARYMIWDAKRGLDYLVSRPEVDASRLGATGCSGGGTLTMYIAAFDDRVQAAAPACAMYANVASDVGDSEQTFVNFRASGFDRPDFAELFAPKPYLIAATADDYVPLASVQSAYDEISKWYAIYNASDKASMFVGPGPHGTPVEVRQAIYAWMIKWLNGGVGDPTEPLLSLPAAAQLQVTPAGHVSGSDLYQVLEAEPFTPATRDVMLTTLRNAVNHTPSAPAVQVINQSVTNSILSEDFTFTTEPGLTLTARLLIPQTTGRKPANIFVQTDSLDSAPATMWAQAGNVALTLLPRGLPSNVDPTDWSGDFLANLRAMLVGRNLPSMRAYDILEGVDLLSSRPDVDPSQIGASANGVAGVWLLLAAAVDSRLTAISLDRTPVSLRSALLSPAQQDLHDAIIPGFARYWDLTDIVRSVAPRTVNWTNPTDWLANVVSFPACSYDLSGASSYSAQGGAGNIIVGANPTCSWTAKTNATWIVITSSPSQTGNGSVSITVGRNPTAVSRTGTLTIAGQTFTITQAARVADDFDGNGVPDLVWMNTTTREVHVNYFGGAGGASLIGWNPLYTAPGWHVGAVADFDGNGVPDLVWVNDQTNEVHVLYYGGPGGATLIGWNVLYGWNVGPWHIVGAGDFNGDGVPDLVWYNDMTGQVNVNYFGGPGGATLIGYNVLYAPGFATGWRAAAIADFNGDGVPDILWQNNTTAQVNVNYFGGSGGASLIGYNVLYGPGFANGWHIVGALDMDNNGTPDVLWQNDTTGQVNVNYFGGQGGAGLIGFNVLYPAGFTSGWTVK